MAKVTVTESSLENIADAIRAKLGVQTEYKPGEMAAAIQSIPTGGSAVLEHLSVTENGTYTPGAGVDGFDQVTVNVSGGSPEPTSITTLWESENYGQNITTIPLSDSANNYNYLLIGCNYTNLAGNFTSFLLPITGYAIERYPLEIPNVYVKPPQNSLLIEADCRFRLSVDGNQCLVSEQSYLRPVLIKGVR